MLKLSLFLGMVMAAGNMNSTSVAPQAPVALYGPSVTAEEMQFVEMVNAERAERGLSRLVIDPTLVEVSRRHSREMADLNYFSHQSPTRGIRTPMDRYLAAEGHRPSWALVGENLFYCSIVDVARGHTALMGSPGHRANILEQRYERIGVGTYTDERGRFYVTQTFLAKEE
ncbi:MAG: CAP domain-containing protein [Armatimonadota bacterium]